MQFTVWGVGAKRDVGLNAQSYSWSVDARLAVRLPRCIRVILYITPLSYYSD